MSEAGTGNPNIHISPITAEDTAGKIDAVIGPRFQKFIASFDDMINGWIEHIGNGIGNGLTALKENASQSFSQFVAKVDNATRRPSASAKSDLPRSQQTPQIEKTPDMAPDIIASAKSACVGMPQIGGCMSFENSYNPSPSHTIGAPMQGQGMGIGSFG